MSSAHRPQTPCLKNPSYLNFSYESALPKHDFPAFAQPIVQFIILYFMLIENQGFKNVFYVYNVNLNSILPQWRNLLFHTKVIEIYSRLGYLTSQSIFLPSFRRKSLMHHWQAIMILRYYSCQKIFQCPSVKFLLSYAQFCYISSLAQYELFAFYILNPVSDAMRKIG